MYLFREALVAFKHASIEDHLEQNVGVLRERLAMRMAGSEVDVRCGETRDQRIIIRPILQ